MASESNIPEKKKTPGGSGTSLSSEFKKNRLGKYEIKKKIGAGGMGAVYLAVDVELNRTVALKILPREKAQNPTLVKRFKAEGQAAALLRHENIVTVYEAGEADGYLYLALEYVEGTDVHNLIAKRGILPVKRTIEMIRQLTRALEHAYERNIVHRDLKPSNFLIKRDGTVKLTDMGLARSIDETTETGITRAGTTVGTVDYMSPEQARDSKAADVRSDIYSLGCSWYQMLTGEAPFSEGSLTNKLAAHATKPAPDPREKNEAVPEGVVAVIRKMMAKNPKDRYQTPAELLEDLDNKALTRGAVSNNVLAALAGADGESEPVKKWPTPSPSIELPPKMEAVPLLAEAKQIDISTVKIAGGVALVAVVVGLFWLAAQSFSSIDEGAAPAAHPSFWQQGDDGEEGESAYPKGGPKGKPNSNPNGVNPNSPFAASPGTAPGQPGIQVHPGTVGGVSSNSISSADGTGSPLAPRVVGVIVSREGESEHLPEWSQTSEMLAHSGVPSAEFPVEGGLTVQPAGDVPRRAIGVSGDRGTGTPVSEDFPRTTTPRQMPTGNLPAGSAPRTYAPRPPADITIAPGSPPQYVSAPLSPSAPGRSTGPSPSENGTNTARPTNKGSQENAPLHVAESVPSLHAALMNLPPEGGTIELTGSGPFFLPAIDLSGRKRIVLRAAENFTPILVFRPEADADETTASLIRVSGGSLNLVGLNFVLIAEQFPPNDALTMVEVNAGDLAMHDCSFTLMGSRPGPVSAIRLTGAGNWKDRVPANQSRTLLNRVWIRGNALTGLTVDQPASDIIVNNSLLTTGSAPVFSFQQSSASGDGAASASADAAANAGRNCRVLSSTLVADSVWTFEGAAAGFPQTLVATVNSLISSRDQKADRPILKATGRFETAAGDKSAPSASTQWLDWKTEGTIFCGWRELVRIEDGSGMPHVQLSNKQDWQKFWKQPLAIDPFRAEPWPTRPIDDLAHASPFEFDAGSLSPDASAGTEAGPPGCFIEQLFVPPSAQFDRAVAWSKKPVVPADFFDVESGATLTVDINKDDLGLWLAEQDLSQGATIIAEGAGKCLCSPIEIANTSVSIRFQAKDDVPPVLIPQMNAAPEGLSILNPTFILVSNGKLELRDAVIVVDPSSARRNGVIPDWMIRVEQGSFALRRCFLRGPETASTRWKGLIYWSGLQNGRSQVSPQSAGVITDSFLYGPGTIIHADLSGQVLLGRNSVFSSSGSIAEFRLPGGPSPNYVDLQRCTLTPSFSFFEVSHAGSAPAPDARLTFYSEETVFAAPKDYRKGDGTQQVLLRTAADFSRDQLDWWEFSNAYAEAVEHFRAPANEPIGNPQDFAEVWEQFWGPSHVQRALRATNAVALRGQTRSDSSAADWGVEDFNVDRRSKAAKWGETGNPVGAVIVEVPGLSSAPRSGKGKAPTASGMEKSPKKIKPNF
ncbi:MAG: protein kinase [Planctomycetaceae bacterium]